jgi:activator of HSP90 ATPase
VCFSLIAITILMTSGCDTKPTVEDKRPEEYSEAIQGYIDGGESTPVEIELMEKLIAEGRTVFEQFEYSALCKEARRIELEREQKKAKGGKGLQGDW